MSREDHGGSHRLPRADVYADDGDPFGGSSRRARDRRYRRKDLQLGGQVARAVGDVLAELGDPTLDGLFVEAVLPVRGARRLQVMLRTASPEVDISDVQAKLESLAGWLRDEVAHAITRRRPPLLVFVVLGAHERET